MYHAFFGLKEAAFSIAVNPRYLFMSQQHREALAHLLYGIEQGGFVMLTGEVGTGKTTMIRCLLEQLPENADIAFILNPMANAPELLCTICDELGVSYAESDIGIKALTDVLYEFLLANHSRGRKTILLIDEAQLLRVPVLEQIRLLTNLETTTEKLLQIILVGQPELKALLARPQLRQLSQRITARFHLDALTLQETRSYIAHRLTIAGMPANLKPFSDDIIARVHEFSGGIPRLINVLCERLLLGAYAAGQHHIDNKIFNAAVREVSGTTIRPKSLAWIPKMIAGAACAFMVGGSILWWAYSRSAPSVLPVVMANSENVITEEVSGGSSSSLTTSSLAATDTFSSSIVEKLALEQQEILAKLAFVQGLRLNELQLRQLCATSQLRAGEEWVCEKQKLSSWNELKDINRPMILTLLDDDKRWRYVLVTGLGKDRVQLQLPDDISPPKWRDLAARWNGDVLFLWRKPVEFKAPLQQGDKGEAVTWLANTFASLDKQSAPLTRHFYTEKLKRRVELFQTSQGIFADGIFGSQTLRKLNEVLGREILLKDIDNVNAKTAEQLVGDAK